MKLHVPDNVRKFPRIRNSKFILKKQEAHGVNSKLISTNKLSRRVIFCSVTELANRQITRQSTYESIYSFQTLDEKKPRVGTDKNAGAACVTLFANNPGPQSELCFNSTLNTGDCVLTFISSASYWNSQPALSLNDSPLPPPCLAYCN